MKLFCANCGVQLKLIRKALSKYGTIIDLVDPHVCLEVPVDPSTVIVEAPLTEGVGKFVKSLNELSPPISHGIAQGVSEGKSLRPSSMTGTGDLRDRRFDQADKVASTAPSSVLDQIKSMGNSIPSHDIREDTTDSEMGGIANGYQASLHSK